MKKKEEPRRFVLYKQKSQEILLDWRKDVEKGSLQDTPRNRGRLNLYNKTPAVPLSGSIEREFGKDCGQRLCARQSKRLTGCRCVRSRASEWTTRRYTAMACHRLELSAYLPDLSSCSLLDYHSVCLFIHSSIYQSICFTDLYLFFLLE